MAMAGPRFQCQVFDQAVGPTDSNVLEGCDYRGLLFSQSNWRLPNGSWSGGGSFDTVKTQILHSNLLKYRLAYDSYVFYDGHTGGVVGVPTVAPTVEAWKDSYPQWAENETRIRNSGWFATGYARTRPGNPMASLSQFLIELRDLPRIPFTKGLVKRSLRGSRVASRYTTVPLSEVPKVLRRNLSSFRNLGSEYLNVVFGWKPFVNDLRKLYGLWKTIDRQLAQIHRDNGKSVHRKAEVTSSDDSTTSSENFPYPWANVVYAPLDIMSGSTSYNVVSRSQHKVWFVADYRYYIPDIGSSEWTKRATTALFGNYLTPEVAWEVMPWSWLIDWFSNVGDVASNLSANAVDNLTLNYSYTMEHTVQTTEATAYVNVPDEPLYDWSWKSVDHTFSSLMHVERKSRVGGGNPFGIGVTLESLDPSQLAILAALGISRSKVVP